MTARDAAPLAGADGLARWLTRVAGSMALLLTLAAPAGYWLLVRQAEAREAALAARLQAAFLIQAIGGEAEGWADRVQGLVDVPLVTSALPEQRLVLTRRGDAVSMAGDAPPWPVVDGRAELSAGDVRLGEVSVRRSLRPHFLATAAVAAVAALFGLALFAVLRLLPLRALRQAFERLRAQETQERGRVEERLRIVLDNALDGVVVYRADGTLLSVNHAVQRMLGEGAALPRRFQDLLPGVDGIGQHQAELRRADGHGVPVDVGISDLALPGEPQRIAIVRDITERLRHEAKLAEMANYDPLTGLGNRSLFRERLVRALQRARHHGQRAALMFIDLDRFKQVNDTLGHGIGDQLLVAVVQRLAQSLRTGDEVAMRLRSPAGDDLFRLGGDEFTVLLSPAPREPDLAQVAQRLIDALQQPFDVGGNEIYISASIGITLDEGGSGPAGEQAAAVDVDTLVKQADLAMYRAKEMGRNGYFFFNDALDAGMRERHRLEGLLHRALARQEFLLHYQPKVDADSGALIGVEALLRWQSPEEGRLVSPLEFVPILEDSGLIASVGTWVLEEACRQLMDWQRQGLPPVSMAVNISARQLRQGDLAERVGAVLAATGVPPHLLELELTESMLIEDSEGVLALLKDLKQLGLRIAIDDFGTGHSSLAYLKRFDLDTLKIDRAFVRDTPHDTEDCAIARAIVALADGLGLHTVAEGVETTAQVEFLRGLGCRVIQGYLISKPLPAPALLAWARDRQAQATPA